MLDLLHRDDAAAARVRSLAATAPQRPLIGYRRAAVRVTLAGGWQVRIPGELLETEEENGTWLAFDDRRTVRVSSLSFARKDGRTDAAAIREALRPSEDLTGVRTFWFERHPNYGWAELTRGEQERWSLTGQVAGVDTLAICTIDVAAEADTDWAVETWKSLRHGTPEATST